MAEFLAGVTPGEGGSGVIADQLASLEHMPGIYEAVTQELLTGLSAAKLHEQRAREDLTPAQRHALDTATPGQEMTPALADAVANLDRSEVIKAQMVLQTTAKRIVALLESPAPEQGSIQRTLAESLGKDASVPWGALAVPEGPTTPGMMADKLLQITSADPAAATEIEASLQEVPGPVLEALDGILDALQPLSDGQATPQQIIVLGAAVDHARPILEVWAAAALARDLMAPHARPALPDPSDPLPDLGFLFRELSERTDRGAVDGAQALQRLAVLSGDDQTALHAIDIFAAIQDRLDPGQADAVAGLLDAVSTYWEIQQALKPLDGKAMERWAMFSETGRLPSPESPDAQELMDALPDLQAHRDGLVALEGLLEAIEETVAQFMPGPTTTSSHGGPDVPGPVEPGPACDGPPINVTFLLVIDDCVRDNVWRNETILAIDVGGNDTYLHRAGAPFMGDPGEGLAPQSIPFNILLDVGGSDRYDSGGKDCSQAAACHWLDAGVTGATQGIAPLSVLVDHSGDGTRSENTFLAGNQSQAYASPSFPDGSGILDTQEMRSLRPVALLVEQIGRGAHLESTYRGGDGSQGSAHTFRDPGSGAFAALVRLVGPGSVANGSFHAGDFSQGESAPKPGFAHAGTAGAFINAAGTGAKSDDAYVAGAASQGAVDPTFDVPGSNSIGTNFFAFFVDMVEAGGVSNDTYQAGARSQGYNTLFGIGIEASGAWFWDLALPSDAETDPGITASVEDGWLGGDPSASVNAVSDDQYLGDIGPGEGMGVGPDTISDLMLPFLDIGGDDTYASADRWGFENKGPGNDKNWASGRDVGFADADGDLVPSILELGEDPHDDRSSPVPTGSAFLIDLGLQRDRVLDGPHSFILKLGGDDEYRRNFSAGLVLDLGGDDLYLGRVGAAGAPPTTLDDVPATQGALAFHLDLAGDDTYVAALDGVQGFGGIGAIGLLFDLTGRDHYEADRFSQGATNGGIGILLDGQGTNEETNRFRAGPYSQGHSPGPDGPGIPGVAILAAAGSHNTIDDGQGRTGASHNGSSGASLNLGRNDPPTIIDSSVAIFGPDGSAVDGALERGVTYRFRANITDSHDDDVSVRWTFEYGDDQVGTFLANRTQLRLPNEDGIVTAEIEFSWNETYQAVTDHHDPQRNRSAAYEVRLEAWDTGGAEDPTPWNDTVEVLNLPPRLAGPIQGEHSVSVGQRAAYQLPFVPAGDMDNVTTSVDWGDGTTTIRSGDAIDWALARSGGAIRLPDAVPLGTSVATVQYNPATPLSSMIDGDNSTTTIFQYDPSSFPPIHFFVDLSGEHNVGVIDLLAEAPGQEVRLSVEGILPSGRFEPLGAILVDDKGFDEQQQARITLPDRPLLKGVLFRQLTDPGETLDAFLQVHDVKVQGPGDEHTWAASGEYEVNFTVIDKFGGRNSTSRLIQVVEDRLVPADLSDAQIRDGLIPGIPLRLMDVNGRGQVRHASVAQTVMDMPVQGGSETVSVAPVNLTLGRLSNDNRAVCILWGDPLESEPDCQETGPGSEPLSFNHAYMQTGDPLVRITYGSGAAMRGPEDLVQLHIEQGLDLRTDDGTPLLFLALDSTDESETRTTWHSGPDGVQYAGIVDRTGNDRYLDLKSGFVLDLSGHDDYLSETGGTQAFAAFGSASFLADLDGDDIYIAPSMAQGTGIHGGVAALLDVGGDDRFNPLGPDHDTVGDGFPYDWGTWLTRPEELMSSRAALQSPQGGLMQGAAIDGVGMLLVHGGFDSFIAGPQSQGAGFHDPRVEYVEDYAMVNRTCATPVYIMGPGQQMNPLPQLLCAFGVDFTGPRNNPLIPQGPPLPFFVDATELTRFLDNGPRYGAAAGLLQRTDGPSVFHAGRLAQGASGSAARGVLFDLDGGFVAEATAESQGYTRNGLGGLLTQGHHVLGLDQYGQATNNASQQRPESYSQLGGAGDHQGLAIYLAPHDRDLRCSTGCPSDQDLEELAGGDPSALPERDAYNLQTPPVHPQGPDLAWGDGGIDFSQGVGESHDSSLALTVDVTTSEPALETVAVAQHLGDDDGTNCVGAPVAPPTVLLREPTIPVPDDGRFGFHADFTERLSDGPLHPSACTRFVVFARAMDDQGIPVTGWSKLTGDAWMLPAPDVILASDQTDEDGLPLVISRGADTAVDLVVREPLALRSSAWNADIQLRATNDTGSFPLTFDLDASGSSPVLAPGYGVRMPGTIDVPLDSGTYGLEARVAWDGYEDSRGEWGSIGALIVDKVPPVLELGPGSPLFVKADTPVRFTGNVTDFGTDVSQLRLRLLDENCQLGPDSDCIIGLEIPSYSISKECDSRADRQWHHCVLEIVPPGDDASAACPASSDDCFIHAPTNEAGSVVQAALAKTQDGLGKPWDWTSLVKPTNSFPGGAVRLEANATDIGGFSTGWIEVPGFPGLTIDKRAPSVLALVSDQDSLATRSNYTDQPLRFNVTYEDCSADPTTVQGECRPGAGIDGDSTAVLIRNQETQEVVSLVATESTAQEATFEWSGSPGGPDAGLYEIQVQAIDRAGNVMIQNPGLPFIIDRTDPFLDTNSLSITLPEEGQTAIKPGDQLQVRVNAADPLPHPAGIRNVTARLGGTEVDLDEIEPNLYGGDLPVSGGLLEVGQPDIGIPVEFEVSAVDHAGNNDSFSAGGGVANPELLYYQEKSDVTDLTHSVRSTSLSASWRTPRPVTILDASVIDPLGGTIEGVWDSDGLNHSVEFRDLLDDTLYKVNVTMQDDALFLRHMDDVLSSVTTPPIAPTDIVVENRPDFTRSGTVFLNGTIVGAVPGQISLHLGSVEAEPIRTQTVDVPLGEDVDHPFTFQIDTGSVLPESRERAITVPFHVKVDDGATTWTRTSQIRIDNAPPQIHPSVAGVSPESQWFNHSVLVDAGATDDTGPLFFQVKVDDGAWLARSEARLSEDGVHEVRFNATDSARPANRAQTSTTVKIDTKPPTLDTLIADGRSALNRSQGPLRIEAIDPDARNASGINGYRVGVDGNWTDWATTRLDRFDLPGGDDGIRWIEVEVRDRAGNTVRDSRGVLLDRAPPEVLGIRWVGLAGPDEGVIHVVSQDGLNQTPGAGSGLAAMRVGNVTVNTTDWAPWQNATGNDAVSLRLGDPQKEWSIQLRDEAGNIGPSVAVPAPGLLDELHAPANTSLDETEPATSITNVGLAPSRGTASTRFVFSAVVQSMDGQAPSAVHVEIDQTMIEMDMQGPPLEGGGQLYTAGTKLEPSRLDEPHRFRIHVLSSEGTQKTPWQDGPTVVAAGWGDDRAASGSSDKGIPAMESAWVVLALVLLATRRLAPDEPNRRKRR